MAAMINVLKALYSILEGDSQLTNLLSTYQTEEGASVPAIFDSTAPEGAIEPYIVITTQPVTPGESHATERMPYTVDTYDNSTSKATALAIAARVKKLLDLTSPTFEGHTSLGIWWDFQEIVPEEDPKIQHITQIYVVRYGRNDL